MGAFIPSHYPKSVRCFIRRIRPLSLLLALLIVLPVACNDDISPTGTAGELVTVSGRLEAWRCGVGDVWNNPYDSLDRGFSSVTGEPAVLRFIRDGMNTAIVVTDDQSDYRCRLKPAEYVLVVETGWTWPDTFDVAISSDTAITFHIVVDVIEPDTFNLNFYCNPPADSLGWKEEWRQVLAFNEALGRPFDLTLSYPPRTQRVIHDYIWSCSVNYPAVLRRRTFHTLEVKRLADSLLEDDTQGLFAEDFYLQRKYLYFCLDSRSGSRQAGAGSPNRAP